MGKPTLWFPNRSDTNRPVQAQKQARSLKFWIYKVEKLYYPLAKTKALISEADLRLCFRLCRSLDFPCGGSYHTCKNSRSRNCTVKTRQGKTSTSPMKRKVSKQLNNKSEETEGLRAKN